MMHCNKEELRKDIKRYRNPTWLVVEQPAKNYERSMVDEEPHKVVQVKQQMNKKEKAYQTAKALRPISLKKNTY